MDGAALLTPPSTPPQSPPQSPTAPALAPSRPPSRGRGRGRGWGRGQGFAKSKIKLMDDEDLPPDARAGHPPRSRSRSRSRSPTQSDGGLRENSSELFKLGEGRTARPGARSDPVKGTRVAKRLAQPPAREGDLVGGKAHLLKSTAGAQHGEEYSKDEKLLNEFLKVHPMMSFDMTSKEVGELLSSMMVRVPSVPPELPCIPKSYDDSMLR